MKKETIIRIAVGIFVIGALLGSAIYSTSLPSPQGKYVDAISAGGEWFLNHQNESFLYYEFIPVLNVESKKHQYLREMGAMWSIAKLAHFLDDERYTELANKGFSFFEKTFKYDPGQDISFVNITPHKIKLGYNAFVILTLLELGHEKSEELLKTMANGILFQQEPSGQLKTFFYSSRKTGVDFYPGEAMFALMNLYEKTKEKQYVQAVEKALPYYRTYWRENQNTGFIPWQTRAYRKLYLATGKSEISDFIFEMNDWLLDQHPSENCSHFDFSKKGIVTAVFMEGMVQAYLQAKDVGDTERAACYKTFVQEGADYIISLQVSDPEDPAYGGFLSTDTIAKYVFKKDAKNIQRLIERGKTNPKKAPNFTRVDNNQHAVTALIEAYEYGLLK